MLISPKLRKEEKLECQNSGFTGGSQFIPGVNKMNNTRGIWLRLGFVGLEEDNSVSKKI